jgi:hypothetical protein
MYLLMQSYPMPSWAAWLGAITAGAFLLLVANL